MRVHGGRKPLIGYIFARLALSFGGLLIIGCTRTYKVETTIPIPVAEPLSLTATVHYTEAFSKFVYRKESSDGTVYIVELGSAQVTIFDKLFNSLFEAVAQTTGTEALFPADPAAGLVIELSIDDFAVATPDDNGLEFNEVTIGYRLSMYTPEGDLIGVWSITGYGRDRRRTFKPFRSVVQATKAAMRDAATLVAVDFRSATEVGLILCRYSKKTDECLENIGE